MGKTASVASAQDFWSLLQKSGLLQEPSLQEARELVDSSQDARNLARQLVSRSLITKWQAAQLLNGFHQLNLGKYRLLDQIGVGRIGREFLAEHLHLGRRVAIKLVSRSLTADAKRLELFLNESRRAVSLDHTHLVHSYDVDQEGQRYYVVTEFVDGEDLQRRIQRQGAFSLAEAMTFVMQAAEGLAHAAANGVTHGDLKPSNLIVDKQGAVKVADLGFASLVDGAPNASQPRDSQEQNLNDGIEYCAPEALNATEGDLDARADIFSLGQTLYFLLTATAPSSPSASAADRNAALLTKQPGLNPAVASLYARFTSPQPDNRPASWQEAIALLRQIDVKSPESRTDDSNSAAPALKKKPPVAKAISLADAQTSAAPSTADSSEAKVADSSPVETQPFIITTGDSRRGRTPSKPSDAPTKATETVPADKTTPADATSKLAKPRKKPDRRLVLGIAIGGGILMLLISIGVLWALLGDQNKDLAERPKEKKAASATSEVQPTEPSTEKEANADEVNPEEVGSGPTVAEPKSAPAKSTDSLTPAASGDKSPATATNEKPAPDKESVKPPVDAPKAEATSPKVEAPKADEPPKADPPKSDPPKTDPPKAEPKPEPKPAPPKPAGNPFDKLPATVSLPDVPSAEMPPALAVLGEADVPSDKLLLIALHGGESANRGRQFFTLQNAGGGTDTRNWEITLSGKGGEADALVAKLHLDQNKLSFEWTPQAVDQPLAVNLSNCLLQLTSGSAVRNLALREPVEEVDPVTIDLEKGTTVKLAYENPPSADNIKVEFVGLDPAMFPNAEFKPESSIAATRGVAYMWFGEKPETRNLGLKLDASDKTKAVEVRLQPVFRMDVQQKQEERVTKKLFLLYGAQLEQNIRGLTAGSAAIEASKLSKEQKESQRNLVEVQQKKFQEQLEKLTKAMELQKKVHNQGMIHVRVYHDTGSGKVVLAQTKGAPADQPPKPKPEEKK